MATGDFGTRWLLTLLAAALALTTAGCVIDSAIGTIAGGDHVVPPPAPPTYLLGQFETEGPFGLPAGTPVAIYSGNRSALPDFTAQMGDDGSFEFEMPGTTSLVNATLYANSGALAIIGVVPEVPAARSVWDNPSSIVLAETAPVMNPIDDVATVISLLMEGKVRQRGGSLAEVSPRTTLDAMEDLEMLIAEEGPIEDFDAMVTLLLTEATAQTASTIPVFLPPDQWAEAGSPLNVEFLTEYSVDYTGDGTPDTTVDAFEDALNEAMLTFEFDVCFDPNLIRVVFMVDFNEGLLDGNCDLRPRETWLSSGGTPRTIDPDGQMFITGGVNQYMVRCEEDPDYEYCATQADVDLTNEAIDGDPSSGWQPNRTPLFDDGTNGDVVAGDRIFSRAFALSRGMRIGYKYTWGQAGSPWTGTEEWPGNGRLLELIDQNGDGMVIRFDNWGDEATNKDRVNGYRRGRGNVVWECPGDENCCTLEEAGEVPEPTPASFDPNAIGCVDPNEDGYPEYVEQPVDLDGDCVEDGWAPVGANTPVFVDCPEE